MLETGEKSGGPTEVMIAPDNLWAADVTVGACTGLAHRGLVRRARVALQAVESHGVVVRWGWTKGHSEHKWNDIADALAEEGRRDAGEVEESVSGKTRKTPPKRRTVLRLQQKVDAQKVREAAEGRNGADEAKRWLTKLRPNGDGTATVEVVYTKTNPYARRNAEGVSLQFCSKELRQKIAGDIYVEVDIKGSHPTMLRAQLRRVGVSVPLLDRWVTNRVACMDELRAECRKMSSEGKHAPTDGEIKELVLAMINGASAEKWARERWNMKQAPAVLGRFSRDLRGVRTKVDAWFPQIWQQTQSAKNDWARRARTVYFAMIVLEDSALEAMRRKLPSLGLQCDALTGDGLLVRAVSTDFTPLQQALRALEEEVLTEVGVEVALTAKTLNGGSAVQWHCPEPSPWERGHNRWHQQAQEADTWGKEDGEWWNPVWPGAMRS